MMTRTISFFKEKCYCLSWMYYTFSPFSFLSSQRKLRLVFFREPGVAVNAKSHPFTMLSICVDVCIRKHSLRGVFMSLHSCFMLWGKLFSSIVSLTFSTSLENQADRLDSQGCSYCGKNSLRQSGSHELLINSMLIHRLIFPVSHIRISSLPRALYRFLISQTPALPGKILKR